ncbi:Tyrocidine synthase 3 [Dyella sp. AD56]|uniref:hybrid non-ribosomal peptide synthetase/type I polyketide synthase n=1 Tax=Dyella sp. AD56 TaxID=1528744 RepID=UPI000C82D11F|nr:hybrid non-ribosomal peptide synthetase/type I polyketide synthase [Dyella sp. AD56]PMQ04701.1 Tyrocidine synthase 3 [Dyella sp. AD56]
MSAEQDSIADIRGNDQDATIAIIGMAGRFSGADDLEAFWANVVAGAESLRDFDDSELRAAGVSEEDLAHPRYVRRGGLLDGIEAFDAEFFGMSALEARAADPQQRLFLETAWTALEHAGYAPDTHRSAVGVYAAASSNVYFLERLAHQGDLMESIGALGLSIGNEKDYLATRTAYKLGLQGPAVTVQTACSSSLVAVHLACQALLAGECDMALAGGVSVRTLEPRGYRYVAGGILSSDGHCRPFDADASGTVSGDGVGVVVLKPLKRALADGDHIHAVILGSAVNNDGHDKTGYTAPSVKGQAAVIREAMAVAGVRPGTIGYVEAHGTGTALGDPIEITALREAFGDAAAPYCALGAVKTNIGHLEAAAGIAGFIKAALAVSHGKLPPNPLLRTVSPHINMAGSPFWFPLAPEPWPLRGGVRRAGVSSFGIGGTNAHVILESPPRSPAKALSTLAQPWLVSARTPEALGSAMEAMGHYLSASRDAFGAAAYTTRAGRKTFRHRCAVAATDAPMALKLLKQTTPCDTESVAPLVFFFPAKIGQLPVAMVAALYATYPTFREDVDACIFTLEPLLSADLRSLLLRGDAEAHLLDRMDVAEPVVFVLCYALARLLQSFGLQSDAMIGHGMGECVAACLAGVMGRDDALRLLATRGRLKAGLTAGANLAEHGRCLEQFAAAVSGMTLSPPSRRYVSNLDGQWMDPQRAVSADYWVTLLSRSVGFPTGLTALAALGEVTPVDVGPGAAMGALACAAGVAREAFPTAPLRLDEADLGTLRGTLAALWARGHQVDWDLAIPEADRRRTPVPTYVFARERHWVAPPRQLGRAPADAPPGISSKGDVRGNSSLQVPGWKRMPISPADRPARAPQDVLWFADPAGADRPVLSYLRTLGWHPIIVESVTGIAATPLHSDGFALDPAQPDSIDALIAQLDASGSLPSRIVYAWAMSARDTEPFAERMCLHAPIALVRALGKCGNGQHFEIETLTVAAQSVDGREHEDPVQALVAGFCKVSPLEYPRIACRWIDSEEAVADAGMLAEPHLLAMTLAAGFDASTPSVAFRGRHAWVPDIEEIDATAGPTSLREDGHYLVLGGTGGIGLAFAEYLVERVERPRLSLFARAQRMASDELTQQRLDALRARGAEVRLFPVDITDIDAMRHAVADAVSIYGHVDVVLHAAGAAGEGLIRNTDPVRLAPIVAPKTTGLRALDAVLPQAPSLIVLCSSVNALKPMAAQVGYCAANAYLDAYAQKRSRAGRRVVSINWSRWEGIGMAAAHGGVPLDAQTIAEAFDAALTFDGRQLLVAPGGPDSAVSMAAVAGDMARPPLQHAQILTGVHAIWNALFGREKIGDEEDFFLLGGHSLLALQLIARVQRDFGVELPLHALLSMPTIAGMTQVVWDAVQGRQSSDLALADRTQPLPLSWSQQRLWFLDRLDASASAAYHIAAGVRLRGQLEEAVLQRTLDRIVERHEALRTRFEETPAGPVQVVLEPSPIALMRQDLSGVAATERDAALEAACAQFASSAFDLAAQPPVRALLVRLVADEHVLVLVQHHIVSDGWSLGVLVRELGTLYAAYVQGQPDPLPTLPVQYADYAAWQRSRLSEETAAAQIAAWCSHLHDAPALLDLPTDRPRPAIQSYRGGRFPVQWDGELVARLRALAQTHGVTLYMTLLAGWSALLSRLSGQGDVVIGTPVANRPRVELEGLIGFFVNTLALRMRMPDEMTVSSLLAQAKAVVLENYERQEVPFERVVEALHPARSLSHSPVFQSLLSLDNTPERPLVLPDLDVESYVVAHGATQFDLTLTLRESDAGLSGAIEYASDLFDAQTIARWSGYLEVLLRAMTEDPERAVATLPLLTDAERSQLLESRVAPLQAEIDAWTLVERFHAQVSRTPEAIALRSGQTTLSYAALNDAVNRVAHALIERGVTPDTCVGLCAPRGVELVIGLLGILKAGGAYVPLDPSYPRERVWQMLDDSAPRVVVSAGGAAEQVGVDGARVLDVADTYSRTDTHDPVVALRPEHLAYVIYTSGSTGVPKGVMIEHRHVAALFNATEAMFAIGPDDVWTVFHSYAFDFSVWELWGALLYGGCAVLVSWECARSPGDFLDLLANEQVTILSQTPSAFRQLIAAGAGRKVLPALKAVVFGGEALDPRMLNPWIEGHPPERVALINMYGITEITVHATYHRLQRKAIESGHGSPIGEALPHLQLHVLDGAGRHVPVGVPGELYIGGASIARGYLGREALTTERFMRNPFGIDGRLYRTGDVARLRTDGGFDYLGRNDFQVKIRGHRIELGDVEAALRSVAGVRDAVVEARGSEHELQLIAYFEADEIETPVELLRASLMASLPSYMVPTAFVRVEQWPLTPSGKLDRSALPEPDKDALLYRAYRAPTGSLEHTLVEIWAEALQLPVERIGVDDNFFELGGDSIRSIVVIADARRRGLAFAVIDLFRHPTVAALARSLEDGPADMSAAGEGWQLADAQVPLAELPEGAQEGWRATLLQQGMIFHGAFGGKQGTYHDIFSYRIALPQWNEKAMRTALDVVAARHPSLRSAFYLHGDSALRQYVRADARIDLQCFDLRHLSAESQHAVLLDFMADEQARPWTVDQGPLIVFFVHRRGESEIQLTIGFHHAILDGWSVAMMQSEVFTEYFRACGSNLEAMPLATVSPMAGASLELSALQNPAHARFWAGYLADAEPTLLPDMPGPWAGRDARNLTIRVPAPVARRLAQLASELSVPLRSVLLSAHLHVVGLLSGSASPMTGVVYNTRPEMAGGERTLGLFLNTLPLRLTSRQDSWRNRVRAVFEEENLLAEHRYYPYFRILSEHGHCARLDVVFNYVHFHAHDVIRDAVAAGFAQILVNDVETIESTGFGLSTTFSGAGEDLALTFDADRTRFGHDQVTRIADAYLQVLQSIANDADAAWEQTSLLTPTERDQVTYAWNATDHAYPEEVMHAGFERHVSLSPDAVAVVCGEEQWSYAALNMRANRIAHGLLAAGVQAGDRVGICLTRGPWMVAAVLGVVKAGAAYVPMDPSHPAQRQAETIADGDPRLVLSERSLSELEGLSSVPVLCVDEPEAWNGHATWNPSSSGIGVDAQALAYVIYTSGSTGRPKGVMVRHAPAVNLFAWVQATFGMGPSDRVLFTTSLSFDLSVYDIFGLLWSGGSVHVARTEEVREPAKLVQWLSEGSITFWDSAPAVFGALVSALNGQVVSPSLRLAFFSGDWIGLELPDAVRRSFPQCEVVALGGATEATVWSNYHRVGEVERHWKSIPYGRPIWNARYYVLDSRGEPSPVGVPGDLYIGGGCLADGYWNRPELTAERFVASPFMAGERMYRTGDRARYWPDGTMEFLGRNDFQVKVRGYRIELGEIEAALQACAGVRDAVVVARGEAGGERTLVAYWQGEESTTATTLRHHLQGRLPGYMVPSAYVRLDAWPLTPNGKLDRSALPAPEADALIREAYAAPMGEVEEALSQLWSELLGVDRVGRHDHFFALGGHSLLLVQLSLRVRDAFAVEVPIDVLMRTTTLDAMASRIAEARFETYLGADTETLLHSLDALSREELLALLAQEEKDDV